jgi:hydroxymethylbilane synthase
MAAIPLLRLGTRGSPLALVQANLVRDTLARAHAALAAPDAIEIRVIRTTGDKVQDRALAEIGGKGLFTKEIEEGLIAGEIDIAVHSAKDMPTVLPQGLHLAAVLEREDPRDVLFARDVVAGIDDLPHGARLGTASLRRAAQLLHRRRDLVVGPLRGNVETRLRKLAEGQVDATLLALAGLKRLGRGAAGGTVLSLDDVLPAPAQGAICIEARERDARVNGLLAAIDHAPTMIAITAERALLAALDGSCRTPIAALAETADGSLRLRGLVATPDGAKLWRTERSGASQDAARIGREAGETLRREAGWP